ncbi:hypothetical protein F5Y19DRAFT_471767 [Xylariaceae sp. FL1651]|nr:hypothetical protein F5Y19DRAFT_471767 [Xylariaceae sp. FL1651]
MASHTENPQVVRMPVVGTASDGAHDAAQVEAASTNEIPWYDVERDAEMVPQYTRAHLQKLSASVHARLVDLEQALVSSTHETPATKRIPRWLKVVLILSSFLWALALALILWNVIRVTRTRWRLSSDGY